MATRAPAVPLIAFALLLQAVACATAPRPPERAQRDLAPDKSAALRGATPSLGLEAEDQRWGIVAERERKRLQDEQRERDAAATTAAGARIEVVPPSPAPRGQP